MESSEGPRYWKARLDLEFTHFDGRTRLARSSHEGPLRVQRVFHPEANGKAHCYLLHPPGGVVMGDDLRISVVHRSGRSLITTPSAGRFYSTDGKQTPQLQHVDLEVRAGSLEWLPQETILFSGADAKLHTAIDLHEAAQLAYWDVLVLGRPAAGERFTDGALEQRLQIVRAGRLALSERIALRAGDRIHEANLGAGLASTLGIAVFSAEAPDELLSAWLERTRSRDPDGAYGITQRGEFLIARYRGEDAQRCRAAFVDLWEQLGVLQDGTAPQQPRIWHT